jgi:predicted Zn finger-like uncharacterized protein
MMRTRERGFYPFATTDFFGTIIERAGPRRRVGTRVKFLCDRCKTRYSIGDDRVRGKILKIRCKNCANVITVREGMSDVDASDPEGLRKRGTTQAVPVIPTGSGLSEPMAAPGSAAPPPALEQEWYVSIDGNQEGPFSLGDAQKWVGSKAFEAELHCWSEGFDDWLPVDKVSHFRGLRKKPAPPPPLPRAATVPARSNTPPAVQAVEAEPEPKPLFAATMASIERNAPPSSGHTPVPGFRLPTPAPAPAPIANATPPGGERAMPLQAKNGTSGPAAAPSKNTKGIGTPPTRLPSFDVGEPPTQTDVPSFDEPASVANDLFAKSLNGSPPAAAPTAPAMMPLATPSPAAAATLSSTLDDDDDSDDDLQIGEVSRVVNLADLKPRPKPAAAAQSRASTAIIPNRTGSMPRIGGNTAAVPRIGGNTAAVPRIDDPDAPMAPLGTPPLDAALAAPPPQVSHRRGMLMLIGAAAAVIIGGVIAVVLMLSRNDDGPVGGLGRSNDIDTTRPDDPLRKIEPTNEGSGSGSQVATNPTGPVIKKPNNTGTSTQRPQTNVTPKEPDPPVGVDKLGGDEIETMARNNGSGTQRCYMRAQRGAEAILIGDVKKVLATLTIAPDGKVTAVSLDKHADNTFGKCLISTISAWKFRASPGGTFRLTLQFVST